jgi:ABC-2 type transport system permease protein
MIRNILILTANDLAIAFKNKTLYLMLFVPIFVFVSLRLVEGNEPDARTLKIALLERGNYPRAMVENLQSAGHAFSISWYKNEDEAKRWLIDRNGDGILIPSATGAEGCALIVLDKASFQTVAIYEGVSAIQRALEGKSENWIAEVLPLQNGGLQRQLLPTWILMLVLLVAFIILPAQVAEEKEKKLLLGLLQTPIREVEWLLAKVSFGTILIGGAALFLHVLTTSKGSHEGGLSYLAFLTAGSFCFNSFGVLVGLLCRTQASARTLGVVFYLPHLLPSALSEFSQTLNNLAPLLPSYQFYSPVKAILLDGRGIEDFPFDFFFLLGVGLVASALSYRLIKRRWLM